MLKEPLMYKIFSLYIFLINYLFDLSLKIIYVIIIKELLKFYDSLSSILNIEPSPRILENFNLWPFFESNLSTMASPRP